jgi:phage gpG-like protein
MVEVSFKWKKGGSAAFLAGIKELARIGGSYNKDYLEKCADSMLTNKYGMRSRAFSGQQNPATDEPWRSLSDSWQKIRKQLGRSTDTNLLVFGYERVKAEWGTHPNGKRKKVKAASWTSSGGEGLKNSIRRSEYANGSISIGTNDPKGSFHQTEGAGRGKVKRPFLGMGKKDYEIFTMLFNRIAKQIASEAKAKAE